MAECYKRDNGYNCVSAAQCTSWTNDSFCGWFGDYGGAMLPPPLEPHFKEIREAYDKLSKSAEFLNDETIHIA